MAKEKTTRRRVPTAAAPTPFEDARDELFQHIMRCGVVGADAEHQSEWFGNTLDYLADRFHELTPEQMLSLIHI